MNVSRWSSRLVRESGGVGAKLWPEMMALANGEGVVNLGQGYPDYPGSEVALERAVEALKDPKVNQYSPIGGLPDLTKAISKLYQKRYGGDMLDASTEICVVTSATEALLSSTLGLVDPGDEVIVFQPFFPWYLPSIRLAGGIPVTITLEAPAFEVTDAMLQAAFSPKTKMIIMNTPHNPTGHVLSEGELELIADYCKKYDVICVSDEVYEATLYGGATHKRIADVEGMKERTLTVSGASKMLSLTGWRVGWAYGPADLIAAVRTVHSFATYCAPAPLQRAVAAALDHHIDTNDFSFGDASLIEGNWNILAEALRATGARVCPAQGGYFLVADISHTKMSDLDYVRWLAAERKIAAVPLGMFFTPNADGSLPPCSLVRFAVCKERKLIEQAAANLRVD